MVYVPTYERVAEFRGERKGKKEGEINIVLRQLNRKFGSLPKETVERIWKISDLSVIEQIGDNLLFSDSLSEVLAQIP